jgi:hypothetical protein
MATMGACLVGTAGTKIQVQHSAQGTLPNAVPSIGMRIIFNGSLRECRGDSVVGVRTELWPRSKLALISLTASAATDRFNENLLL